MITAMIIIIIITAAIMNTISTTTMTIMSQLTCSSTDPSLRTTILSTLIMVLSLWAMMIADLPFDTSFKACPQTHSAHIHISMHVRMCNLIMDILIHVLSRRYSHIMCDAATNTYNFKSFAHAKKAHSHVLHAYEPA